MGGAARRLVIALPAVEAVQLPPLRAVNPEEPAYALDWLDRVVRERHPYLEYVKRNGFLDSLRKQPRFQAIERSLRFPD